MGSPATYGSTLATVMACRVLSESGLDEHKRALESAESWLRRAPINSVSAAAAFLLAANVPPGAKSRRNECLAIIERAQTQDGGWGPYVDSPPEVFDTAIVPSGIGTRKSMRESTGRIHRARNFLVAQQDPDGGWPATTRPPGGESYAQRISTTGWATLALLATRE